MSFTKKKIYITYKHQFWTSGESDVLLKDLDGFDDKILEFYVWDYNNFVIIRRNGYTYDVRDSKQDAEIFIDYIYSDYEFYEQNDEYCYMPINNPDIGYLSESDAHDDGYYNVMYIPKGYHYLVKYGKILGKSRDIYGLRQIIYSDYGASFDYIC